MSGLTEADSGGKFLNVTQGRLRVTVDETTPGAKRREWETPDGKSGVKWELVYSKISGQITGIEFKEGEFGEQLNITIYFPNQDENYILTMQSNSRYAIDFMKRLPGVDFDKEVELTPYDIEDNGKRNVGIRLVQGETIRNCFWDYENKRGKGGFPEMKAEKPDKDDWKVYFIEVKKWLKAYTLDNICPKISSVIPDFPEPSDYKGEEDFQDDLPF